MHMHHILICGQPRSTRLLPHYLTNGTMFEKKVPEHKMCVLVSSTPFVWNVSHAKKKWVRYDQNCILIFMQSTRYSDTSANEDNSFRNHIR